MARFGRILHGNNPAAFWGTPNAPGRWSASLLMIDAVEKVFSAHERATLIQEQP
jgi:hypothetical protein